MKFNLFEITNWVSNSNDEPWAIPKKLLNSFGVFLPAPSSILEGIENTLLFI